MLLTGDRPLPPTLSLSLSLPLSPSVLLPTSSSTFSPSLSPFFFLFTRRLFVCHRSSIPPSFPTLISLSLSLSSRLKSLRLSSGSLPRRVFRVLFLSLASPLLLELVIYWRSYCSCCSCCWLTSFRFARAPVTRWRGRANVVLMDFFSSSLLCIPRKAKTRV